MICKITYNDSEMGSVAAVLAEDAVWTCDDPEMERALNALIVAEDRAPARGDWLGWHAEKVARLLAGRLDLESKPAPSGDVRY